MLTLPLEPTDDLANPAFKNAASCALWIRQLQLTNLQLAHGQLLIQVNELNRYAMRNIDRLNTLEELRETVDHVQNSYATKLISKPLPLNQGEFLVFVAIVHLWQALSLGYQRCLQGHLSGDRELAQHAALLCQRCMLYNGLAIFEHLRTGYEFDGKLWHQLHKLYEFSEEQGLQLKEVPDPLMGNHPNSSCHRIYVKILLACYARPSELTRAQLQLLDNWLSEWCSTIAIEHSYVTTATDAQPLATDLSSILGLRPIKQVTHSSSARYLAMTPLSKLLRVNTILLEQGKTPQQLKLGELSNAKDCIKFFTFLHQCWCEDYNTRLNERQPNSRHAQLCYQAENIYTHIGGESFKQPARNAVANSLALKQMEVLGRVMKGEHNKELLAKQPALETWHLENESIMGAQLTRENIHGERLGFNQLIAIRLSGEEHFALGATAWVSVLRTGQLRIGIRYLPGTVRSISIRTVDLNASSLNNYAPAFLLDPIANLKIPASLIIPRNRFQPNRVMEVAWQDGKRQQVELGFSVERGLDYERVSFKLI